MHIYIYSYVDVYIDTHAYTHTAIRWREAGLPQNSIASKALIPQVMELQPHHHYILYHLGSESNIRNTSPVESLKHSMDHTCPKFRLKFRVSEFYI